MVLCGIVFSSIIFLLSFFIILSSMGLGTASKPRHSPKPGPQTQTGLQTRGRTGPDAQIPNTFIYFVSYCHPDFQTPKFPSGIAARSVRSASSANAARTSRYRTQRATSPNVARHASTHSVRNVVTRTQGRSRCQALWCAGSLDVCEMQEVSTSRSGKKTIRADT